jgi:hypothetical protein
MKLDNQDNWQAVFTVSLSETPTANVSVDYATADVTAEAGKDYQPVSGTLRFSAAADGNTYSATSEFSTTVSTDSPA